MSIAFASGAGGRLWTAACGHAEGEIQRMPFKSPGRVVPDEVEPLEPGPGRAQPQGHHRGRDGEGHEPPRHHPREEERHEAQSEMIAAAPELAKSARASDDLGRER